MRVTPLGGLARKPASMPSNAAMPYARGIILTPVHEMALVGPTTSEDDVDLYIGALRELVGELVAES